MSEKSLIYNMISRFLENPQEDRADIAAEPGMNGSGRAAEPGMDGSGGAAEPGMDGSGGAAEPGMDGSGGAAEPEMDGAGRAAEPDPIEDQRVETVEDWNETEQKKRMEFRQSIQEERPLPHDEEPEGEEEYRDAALEVTAAEDRMSASLMARGPSGGGMDMTADMVMDALEAEGIIYGIDRDKIASIVEGKQYMQVFVIARGLPARDGEDGRIKDYFPRKTQLKYASKGNGEIDFKSMNLIHNVKKGELVCEITMPTEAEDGVDVYGKRVQGRKGTMPPIPQGSHVVYSPDRDKLLTDCEGNLTFRSGRFHVENVYTVSGNVDNSIGNIEFSGSVMIYGDVYEGYSVKAKGDITVAGMVEGAVLRAGGSIQLHKGMRGMKSGVLEAQGDITAKFLEDCSICADNDIQAEYIINSEVSCGHDLVLTGRRGAFIGGSCSVYNSMRVNSVGSPSHIATYVTLGITPQLQEEVEELGRELTLLSRKNGELRKDLDYLSAKQREGTITPKQKERFNKLKLEAPINTMKEKNMRKRAADLARQLREVGRSRLTAREVYPGTVICIGDGKVNISNREDNCSFYYLDGEIRKGIR